MEELQLMWGWQPALYLFLGGVGAGAFLAAGILVFMDRERHRTIAGASMWAAIACLGVGLLLLLSELTNPLRGLLLWQSFSNHTSWMAFGAWAALLALVFFAASALVVTRKTEALIVRVWPAFAEREHAVVTACVSAGMVLAAYVAVYTGMLLMAVPGVPLWNTLLLPCLFAVSACDTGVALVEVMAVVLAKRERLGRTAQRFLKKAVVALVLLEGVVLALFAQVMLSGNVVDATSLGSTAATAAASVQLLVAGPLAPYFWGLLVGCGLVLPLAASLCCLVVGRKAKGETTAATGATGASAAMAAGLHAVMVAGAAGALIGGCTLRFLVLLAGVHADLVADTLAQLW